MEGVAGATFAGTGFTGCTAVAVDLTPSGGGGATNIATGLTPAPDGSIAGTFTPPVADDYDAATASTPADPACVATATLTVVAPT